MAPAAARRERRGLGRGLLVVGTSVMCAVAYAFYGADATGLFARQVRRLQGGGAGRAPPRIDSGLIGKDFQRIPPSTSQTPTMPPTPPETPSSTVSPPPSVSPTPSHTAPQTPEPSASGTPSTSNKPLEEPSQSSAPAAGAPPASAAASAYKPDLAEMRRLYPPREPLPSPPPSDTFASHPPRYLMLVQGQEGFGAWNDQIWEMLDLARTLNRTFVEPCVRNSCLEPCRCGAVHDVRVTDADLAQFDEGADPLNLKFDGYPCEPYTSHWRSQVGWSWPLGSYLDLAALKQYYPHIVRYQDWCDNVMAKDTSVRVQPEDNRWRVQEGAYCGELHTHWCDLGLTKKIGDFYFDNVQFGRPGTVPDAGIMDTLHNEPYHTVFYFGYYRGYFMSPRRGVNVPFHPGHHRAVQYFIKQNFGDVPLTVFQWRSEHVDETMLVPCSHDLAAIVNKFRWKPTPSGYRGLLMSDMPAPNNNHIMWHTYTGSNNADRHVAMETMIGEAKLLKYDLLHNDTDTGVLMIRDFLLGVYADQYITCQGDFVEDCMGCFRSNSNFITRLTNVRREYGKNFMDKWFQMGQNDLAASSTPRRLYKVRV